MRDGVERILVVGFFVFVFFVFFVCRERRMRYHHTLVCDIVLVLLLMLLVAFTLCVRFKESTSFKRSFWADWNMPVRFVLDEALYAYSGGESIDSGVDGLGKDLDVFLHILGTHCRVFAGWNALEHRAGRRLFVRTHSTQVPKNS